MGADVAGHRSLHLLSELDERLEPVPADSTSSYCAGLHPEAAENNASRTEEVSSTPGRGRSHPAQDNPDIPQG